MFYAGQVILGAYGMPTASLTDPGAMRMVLGLGFVMPFFPVIGFAFGVLLRSTAGGITTALGLLWLPQIFGQLVPMWWREHILSLLPSNGLDSITAGHIQPSPAFSEPLVGAIIAATWLVIAVGTAFAAFVKRDA
jgi:ABC-type transport system involved in multi-copper enzyme maturation permease subunit